MTIGKTKVYKKLNLSKLPQHIAIIMDGNGRWATKRGLPRNLGHKAGCENIKRITQNIYDLGIKIVTFFAFSTENWKRPKDEIANKHGRFYIKWNKNYAKRRLLKIARRLG